MSEWTCVNAGVPQGTKLAPLVFLAVINDAVKNENRNIHAFKYVDDLTIVENQSKHKDSDLQGVLDRLCNWADNNKMRLNPKKCATVDICFSRQKPDPVVLTLDDVTIQHNNTVKLLGIFIQSNLKWDTHMTSIVKRANSRLYMLRKLKHLSLSVNDLLTIYTSFVRPVVEYAAPVWSSGITQSQRITVERIQKRACRIILGSGYHEYHSALHECKLDSLQSRRNQLCLSFAKSLPSSKLRDLLPEDRPTNSYNLRSRNTYTAYKCRTERFRNSALPSLIRALNMNNQ